MFTRSARFYDAIYSFKDYAAETAKLVGIAGDKVGGSLLDVACGTGLHLVHLKKHFTCEGMDLDENLLEIARERLPDLAFHQGDMRNFDLGEFDVVTCLFSSIGYVGSTEGLRSACRCFAGATKRGGLLIVEPWFSVEEWRPGQPSMVQAEIEDLKITRKSITGVEGTISTINFEYEIQSPEGIEHMTEHHELGLFARPEYTSALEDVGFAVEYDEEGLMNRGLYICRKRLP